MKVPNKISAFGGVHAGTVWQRGRIYSNANAPLPNTAQCVIQRWNQWNIFYSPAHGQELFGLVAVLSRWVI
ncbi:hypothetical protein RHGRI_001083 [Rhododendron griersonianum]|nr:hypothetical protein RHGRI_001083 [Rhododendron griersonianum]